MQIQGEPIYLWWGKDLCGDIRVETKTRKRSWEDSGVVRDSTCESPEKEAS